MPGVISVLMPALNEERAIEDSLGCVLAQRDVELEVLVILGRCVDRTREVVEQIARNDARVRLLDNPRSTIPAALNIGLAHSRGTYLARIDAHSRIDEFYLHNAVRWLESDHRLASVGGLRIGVGDRPVGRAIAMVLSSPFAIGDSINHFARLRQFTDHASFGVTRADAAREIGGWDETLLVNEDVDFDHRLRNAGYLIGFDPQLTILWQTQPTLPRLFRQFRRYGRGKGLMIRKNGMAALRPRHAVPPLAVLGGASIALGGLVAHRGIWLLVTPYLAGIAAVSARLWWQHRADPGTGPVAWAAVPAGFAIVHTAWGLGMWEGLAGGRQPVQASGNARLGSERLVGSAGATAPQPDVPMTS